MHSSDSNKFAFTKDLSDKIVEFESKAAQAN